jgi:hypothetical protein
MPKGPRGEKRPADVIGAAVMVGRIATGEVKDKCDEPLDVAPEKPAKRQPKAVKSAPRR